ncbi:MAG TPA: hypothetical protein VMJ32_14995 [Pirellulales bacterium]|nr:hypothetical protein [Pirellulales bacterium]
MKFIRFAAALMLSILATKVAAACPQAAMSAASCNVNQQVAPVVAQAAPVVVQTVPTVAVQSYAVPNVAVLATPTIVAPATVLATPALVTPSVVVNTVVHQPRKSARVQISRVRLRSR